MDLSPIKFKFIVLRFKRLSAPFCGGLLELISYFESSHLLTSVGQDG